LAALQDGEVMERLLAVYFGFLDRGLSMDTERSFFSPIISSFADLLARFIASFPHSSGKSFEPTKQQRIVLG